MVDLKKKIRELAKQKNAVILAHNYQVGEVQDVADIVGDSLLLSQEAAKTEKDVIVFCGVHFMAETASILAPTKKVLIPDLEAGCSLASTINAEDVRKWKKGHPGAVVVTYVNCTAEVKAESDYCCTSSNAVKVVNSIPKDKEILFAPDMYLGKWVSQQLPDRKILLWPGSCHVHHKISLDDVKALKAKHPDASYLMHPECGCSSTCIPLADKVLSTSGLIREVKESSKKKFIIGTETGVLYKMRKENPDKELIPVREDAVCEFMKMITLEKVMWSLEDLKFEVKVPKEIADRARLSIDRMVKTVED